MRVRFLLLGLALLTCALVARAAEPEPRVSFTAKAVSLHKVIDLVARNTKLNVLLNGPIADLPITVELKDLPASAALQAVFEAAQKVVPDLRMELKNGIHRIFLKPGGKIPPLPKPAEDPARKITVALLNVPFQEAVDLVYQLPGAPEKPGPVEFEEKIGNPPVHLAFTHDNEKVIVRFLVRQAGTVVRDLGMEEKNGKLVVGLRPGQKRGGPDEFGELYAPPLLNPQRRLVIAARSVPLRQVLTALLDHTLPRFGPSPGYEIDPLVPDTPVSFTLITGKPETALPFLEKELSKQVKGLQIRTENDKLHFAHSLL